MNKLNLMQDEGHAFILNTKKCILAPEQGLGKSKISLMAYNKDVLIICPASLKANWKEQILKHIPDVKEEEITIVSSSKQIVKPNRIIIVNYDILHKVKLPKMKNLLVDEVQMIKSPRSIRSKVTGRYIKQTENVVAISGTPLPNRPIEFWVLLTAMGIIDMKYKDFGFRYCAGYVSHWGYDFRGASNIPELKEIITPYIFRRLKKDILTDLPDKQFKVIALDLPVDYRESEFSLADIVHRKSPVGFEGLAELLHEQSIIKVPMSLDYIITLLESTDEKVVVFGRHIKALQALREGLKKYKPAVVTGATKNEDRLKEVNRFQKDDSCKVFIGNITSAGTGITLTKSRHVVFHETEWSFSGIMQASDRVHRIGQDKEVYIHFLTIAKSIDCYMLKTILRKQKVIQELID